MLELIVNGDPQGLKNAVAGSSGPPPGMPRRRDAVASVVVIGSTRRTDDSLTHAAAVSFLPNSKNSRGQFLGLSVLTIGTVTPESGSNPHVERTVARKAEPRCDQPRSTKGRGPANSVYPPIPSVSSRSPRHYTD